MAEYIKREAAIHAVVKRFWSNSNVSDVELANAIEDVPAADVAPVVHGEWERHDGHPDDYYHHRCTNCKVDAPFDYEYREDWDEGMDGEWYSLGIIEDGINEHLTPHCPDCGAKMDGGKKDG